MKIADAPALITTPFAQNGTRNDIPDIDPGFTDDTAGRAAFATGFPDITMRPVAAGGVPPFGADFNGILYALSNAVRFYGAGGHYKFNADFASKIGGYPMGATVQATDNMGHWLNVVESNSTDPESGLSTGWLPLADHNGTATVTLTDNTTLTSLQAAKANLRFTGTPTGNVTVTFPAWTKRYSIINDCTGDGSVICTTGNGESISIKNGAKYEVGCDGKNLTVATVNASQVFADANKDISALDAPTVQQLLNALGSAAVHAASDFDSAGSAKAAADALAKSLAKIATTGDMADALGTLAIEHGGTGATDAAKARDNLGLKAGATMTTSQSSYESLAGDNNEALTTRQFVDFRSSFIGIPLPWPQETVPNGFLMCNGQSFDKNVYPKLAEVYPSGQIPDLRGEFIRGWDAGRGADTWSGRPLLSWENEGVGPHEHDTYGPKWNGRDGWADGETDTTDAAALITASRSHKTGSTGAGETRPRNVAFNYIVRAI